VVFFNYTTMQLTAKIVYYGPGLCGKTTNLQYIHKKTAARSRGEMVSLETEADRTLFFDLLPLDVGVIGGMKVRLQLYTVPGQVFYNATRKLVLKSVDGVVFVADSQAAMEDANLESISNLKVNLAEMGLTIDQVPLVFQYNKRDLRNILPLETMNATLNPEGRPYFEAAAAHGLGVFETLKGIARLAIASVREKVGPDAIWPKNLPPSGAPEEPVLEMSALEMPALEVTPPRALQPETLAAAPSSAPPEEGAAAEEEEIDLEFAEEGGGGQPARAVKTRSARDIEAELEKLRSSAVSAPRPAPAAEPTGRSVIEKRLADMIGTHGTRQDIKRKASIEVPNGLLKGSGTTMRVQVAFDGPEADGTVRDAVVIRLGANPKLERLTLHIDLEVKGKPPDNG
jgi:signal recognition particle receptor subunit beta